MERCTPCLVNRFNSTRDHVAGSDMNDMGITTCRLRLSASLSAEKARQNSNHVLPLQTKALHLQCSSRRCRFIRLGRVSTYNPTGALALSVPASRPATGCQRKQEAVAPAEPGSLSGSGLLAGPGDQSSGAARVQSAESSNRLLVTGLEIVIKYDHRSYARPGNVDRLLEMRTGNDPVLIVELRPNFPIDAFLHEETARIANLGNRLAVGELDRHDVFSLTVDSAFLSPITTVLDL